MQIRAALIDFDKTLTTEDMSDLLAEKVGKKAESEQLNHLFQTGRLKGVTGLIRRVNFLEGLSLDELEAFVNEHPCLRPGAEELFAFLKLNGIISIIASGSTVPFLEIYQRKLGADYVVGSRPSMQGRIMGTVTKEDYSGPDYKIRDSRVILDSLQIPAEQVVAIGDSMADLGMFEYAAKSIAIDPHPGIEPYVDYIISGDLSQAVTILDDLMAESDTGALY